MRAPDALIVGVPRAVVISGSTPPPRTIIPAGSPISGFQGGNRLSSGSSISAPIGDMVSVLMILVGDQRTPTTVPRNGPNELQGKWIMAGLATPRNHCQHLLQR